VPTAGSAKRFPSNPQSGARTGPSRPDAGLKAPKLRSMTGRSLHRSATMTLSALMALIGAALVVEALSGHGGLLSARTLLGALFLAAGVGRLYVERRRGRAG
jgi:hypothetical protein